MIFPVLTAKLHKPQLPDSMISREVLLKDSHLASMILVSAQAGSGKSTVVSAWLSQQSRAYCWYSLDDWDNDLMQFFAYLAAGIKPIDKHVSEALEQLLDAFQSIGFEAFLRALINQIHTIKSPFILVLDDYHVIQNEQIHQVIRAMLEHFPPSMQLVLITTDHFSTYAVGYNKISFNDVAANAWYDDAVSFVAARDITTGTGNGNYSPDAKLTRGQFLVMVMRAYGIEADSASNDNFSDAGNTYYTGYLAAAKSLGITDGIGNNMFTPGKEITRQEMFTLLYNTLDSIGELPAGTTENALTSYSDAGEIASWATDAMTLFVGTGTISGSGNQLDPADTTNRAQMAQVLYNLISK